jgi:hypothetical protein
MEDLIVWLKWWRLERLKRSRSKIHEFKPLKSPLPLIENRKLVDTILPMFGNEIEIQIFAGAAPLCPDIGRVDPATATQRHDHNLSRRAGRRPTTSAGV